MKRKVLIVIAVFCGLYPAFAQHGEKEFTFTQNERVIGLSELWMGVKSNYVYYDQLKFDWDSLYRASVPVVMAIEEPFEYVDYLRRICALLEDGHTKVRSSIHRTDDDLVRPAPLKAKVFDKKVYVHSVLNSELEEKGVKKGVEILTINGRNTYDYALENVMPYVGYSTPQWKIYNTFCTFELTKSRTGDPMVMEFRDRNGKVFQVTMNKTSAWDKQTETFEYKVLPHNIGYLRINTFNNKQSDSKFDSLYGQILGSDALIIDLRDNGGGNSNYADYILRHFSTEPIRSNLCSSRMYIPSHASWGMKEGWSVEDAYTMYPVNKEIYTKPITVLTNHGTFSSSEDFCSKFRGMERGKLIGTITGGSTGNPIRIELLPDIASAIICTRKVLHPDGEVFVGIGIRPDIEIEETETDFLNNTDPVLEQALTLFGKK